MTADTKKINLGDLFQHIQALCILDEESLFLEEIFYLSQKVLSPEQCANFMEINLNIDFKTLKKLSSKYGFSALNIGSTNYISWQKTKIADSSFCNIAEFFRQIQRSKFSDTIEDLERFEIYKKICDILFELKYFAEFQSLIPISLSFCTPKKANTIANDYELHVVSSGNSTYLGIVDKV